MDLSIIIPTRNEMFLNNTINDILNNIEADTEIIVVLDGQWAVEGITQHEKVTVVYLPESIGQRAATNLGCKLSKARYVMKCDAHCSFGKGFDRILLEDTQDNWTIIPKMYNLHVFDWVCPDGHRKYQGPTPEKCDKCGKPMKREILWKAKPSPETTAMRFDTNLKFQYWGQYKERQNGDLVETMSILGACWMLSREKYWELNVCDENHGGWGQQGTEIAACTWLSGGKLIVDKRTWFAHMFRTQGGDFSFPYPISGKAVGKARQYSKELWLGNNHKKQIHPLSWLLEKFTPIPDWNDEALLKIKANEKNIFKSIKPKKGIIFYTDNKLQLKIAHKVQKNLRKISKDKDIPIVSASLKPMSHFGDNVRLKLQSSPLTMFKQILTALEHSTSDIIFFCEHDVIYHPSHFEFVPPKEDIFYYNLNVWKLRKDGFAVKVNDCKQTSGLCAYRELLINHYKKRVELVEKLGFNRKMGFEPGTHKPPRGVDNYNAEGWNSKYPNTDIRHDNNLTASRWKKEQFRNQKYTLGWIETNNYSIP